MGSSRKNFLDRFFQIKLNEPQIVSDHPLWQEIEKRLEEKKRKRRWFFLLLFSGLLAGAIVSIFYLEKTSLPIPQKPEIAEKSLVDSSSNTPGFNHELNPESGKEDFRKSKAEKVLNNGISNATINHDSIQENHSQKIPSVTSLQMKQNKKEAVFVKKNLQENVSKESVSEAAAIRGNENKIMEEEKSEQHAENLDVKNEEVTVAGGNEFVSGNKNVDSINQADINEQSILPKTDSTVKDLSLENSTIKIDSSGSKSPRSLSVVSTIEPSGMSPKATHLFGDIYINYLVNHRTFTTSGKVDSLYNFRRSNEENVRNSFNYGMHLGIQKNKFQLISGLGFAQYIEDIEYESQANCYFIRNTGGYFNPDSVWIYTYDSIKVEQQNDSISMENGNKKSVYLEVPVNVFYQVPVSNFYLQFGGGISVTFPLKWNSWYLNKDVTALENPSTNKMLQSVVWNFQLSGGIEFPLAKNLHALFDLEYRRNLNSIFKSDYFLDQKYQSFGLQFSIRYWFGK